MAFHGTNDLAADMMDSEDAFASQFDKTHPSHHHGDTTPVPIGGKRIPESMHENGDLAEPSVSRQKTKNALAEFVEKSTSYQLVMRSRDTIGSTKKELAQLTKIMNEYITARHGDRCLETKIDSVIDKSKLVEKNPAKQEKASKEMNSILSSFWLLHKSFKDARLDAADSLRDPYVDEDVVHQAVCALETAESIFLEVYNDLTTLVYKHKNDTESKSDVLPQTEYGNFMLASSNLGRKLFAQQNKLLDVLKVIKSNISKKHLPTMRDKHARPLSSAVTSTNNEIEEVN